MSSRKKLLVISNCQGPVLFNRFLKNASVQLSARYDVMTPVQVHQLKADEAPAVKAAIDAADILVAQPVQNCPVSAVLHDELVAVAGKTGKQLLKFPALHFDCLFAGMGKKAWMGAQANYPFGETEDAALASLFVLGVKPADAVQLFHDVRFVEPAQMETRIERNLAGFESRENEFATDVKISDFYSQNWREQRLHHVKSHPCAVVYQELMVRTGKVLGLDDVDPARTAMQRGNSQYGMPVKRWVKQSLGIRFDDAEDKALFNNEEIPFVDLIETLWAFYKTRGVATVRTRLELDASPVYQRFATELGSLGKSA